MHASVIISLHHDPCRGVRDAEIEDFPRGNERVEAVHDFFNGCGEVPKVQVENVDVSSLQSLETGLHGKEQGFERVTSGVGTEGSVGEANSVFCCNPFLVSIGGLEIKLRDYLHQLVTVFPGLRPLANPLLGFAILVVVGPIPSAYPRIPEILLP